MVAAVTANSLVPSESDAQMLGHGVRGRIGDDLAAPGVAGGEDAMKENLMFPWRRRDREQALEQLAAGQVNGAGTVGPRGLEAQQDAAVRLFLESFPADRRPGEVATEALQAFLVPSRNAHTSVEVVAITDSATLGELVDPAAPDLDALGATASAATQGGHTGGGGGLRGSATKIRSVVRTR
jgi:hypothetical protein